MRKRTAFTMLIRGVERGWSVPDDALAEGIETARAILRDESTGARDRIRAAELLANVRQREADRLLKLAELEETIEDRDEIEGAMTSSETDDGLSDLAGIVAALKAEGPEYARRQRQIRETVARKTAEAAARVRPGDAKSVRLYHETVKALHASMSLALMAALDHADQVRRLSADLVMQSIDDDDDLLPPIPPEPPFVDWSEQDNGSDTIRPMPANRAD